MPSLAESEAPARTALQNAAGVGSSSASILEWPIYDLGYAAFLLGLRRERVRAWLDGCERKGKRYPPVIRPSSTGSSEVTWGEFVGLGYLREYRSNGMRLHHLQPVIADLRAELQTPNPLATAKPYVSHRELVLKLQADHGLPTSTAIVLCSGQTVMRTPETERFFKKVVFDPPDDGDALCLRPVGDTSPVVIDPQRRFGDPSVDGVAVWRLWELHDAGESVEEIAEAYDMTEESVNAAISYHGFLKMS